MTGGTGAGLATEWSREWVIEFDRAERKAAKDGTKSDALDAIRAGREALGRQRPAQPRAHCGMRAAIRVHTVTRDAAIRARTAAINELKAQVVTADDELHHELRGMRTTKPVVRCAGSMTPPSGPSTSAALERP